MPHSHHQLNNVITLSSALSVASKVHKVVIFEACENRGVLNSMAQCMLYKAQFYSLNKVVSDMIRRRLLIDVS